MAAEQILMKGWNLDHDEASIKQKRNYMLCMTKRVIFKYNWNDHFTRKTLVLRSQVARLNLFILVFLFDEVR
jgi:hypothetical protein